jgi:hypothetical protein
MTEAPSSAFKMYSAKPVYPKNINDDINDEKKKTYFGYYYGDKDRYVDLGTVKTCSNNHIYREGYDSDNYKCTFSNEVGNGLLDDFYEVTETNEFNEGNFIVVNDKIYKILKYDETKDYITVESKPRGSKIRINKTTGNQLLSNRVYNGLFGIKGGKRRKTRRIRNSKRNEIKHPSHKSRKNIYRMVEK